MMRRFAAFRRMPLVRPVLIAVLSGVLVLAAAACGSSSSSDSTSTSTTTTAPTTTTSSVGGGTGGKLSAAEWTTLQADVAQAKTVNQQGIATFKKCRVKVSGS